MMQTKKVGKMFGVFTKKPYLCTRKSEMSALLLL